MKEVSFKNHFYLDSRGSGTSKYLRGDVAVTVIYVNDEKSEWDKESRTLYRAAHDRAMAELEKEAKIYGASLNIRTYVDMITLPGKCDRHTYDTWYKQALTRYGKSSVREFVEHFKKKWECDEAPVLFVFNKWIQGFATWAINGTQADEIAVVGRLDDGFRYTTVKHELLHQFGAKDYYYPERTRIAASSFLLDSIMNSGYTVDPMTAYSVGWTDTVDAAALNFLNSTKDVTNAEVAEALEKMWVDRD